MTLRQLQLHLCPHGSPTSEATINYAYALASAFGAFLRITSPRIEVKTSSHWLAGRMLAGAVRDFEQTALQKSQELDAYSIKRAAELGVVAEIEAVKEVWPTGSADISIRGRTSDLNIVGLPRRNREERSDIEAWLFSTGRPCLLHPDDRDAHFSLENILIAWDLSKAAARAVGDAQPFLRRANYIF